MSQEHVVQIVMLLDNCSAEDMKGVIGAVKSRQRTIQERAKYAFAVGDNVQWNSKRVFGEAMKSGVVVRVNRTSLSVITATHEHWTVAPTLCTKI